MMNSVERRNLTNDLILPMLLFGAVGGMTWAVRGSSGYGATAGCIFAGVMLGSVWWYIARDNNPIQSRRYASGWIILAMTVAFGIAGQRGWMQWPHFFNNILYTNYQAGETVYISRTHGFIWTFISGVPWAGLGACALAWCVTDKRTAVWQWFARIACGVFGAWFLGFFLFERYPEVFLPLYSSMEDRYQDFEANPNLRRLINDNYEATLQTGLYLGFLFFEIVRRDWKNVVLIVTVGVLNGIGWALLQNWMWAYKFWPNSQFNFWRAWETTAGVSIGIAYAVAYYLVNNRTKRNEPATEMRPPGPGWLAAFAATALIIGYMLTHETPIWFGPSLTVVAIVFAIVYWRKAHEAFAGATAADRIAWSPYGTVLERWGAGAGLILGLGLSIKNGLKGCANVYIGNEGYWNTVAMNIVGPLMILALIAVSIRVIRRPRPGGDPFPRAYGIVWIVLIVQNVLAQMITGPWTQWNEVVYNIYYLLLFALTGVIVLHYRTIKPPKPL